MEDGGELSLEEKLARDPAWFNHPPVQKFLRSIPVIILVGSLFLLYGYFLAHKIDLVTADIGRHIKNCEILLQDASVLERNFYSYTNPDFPVINHHWGSGLLFYLFWKYAGFTGVQLFFIFLSFAAFLAFLKTARRYAPWGVVGLVALPAIFLLGERTEIRPEVFSYLFAGIFFYILCRFRESSLSSLPPLNPPERLFSRAGRGEGKGGDSLLWLLPIIQVLWVNTHIYFLLGPLILGAFLLEALVIQRERFLKLFWIFAATLAATLINPFGYRAIAGALTLFQNFGYRLAENQSVWFLERLGMTNPNFLIFKILLGVLGLSFLMALYRHWRGTRLAHVFIAAGISTLAFLASRNLTLFGLFLVPLLAANVQTAFGSRLPERPLRTAATVFAAAALFISIIFTTPRSFPYWRTFGLGLEQGNSAAAEFLKRENIRGPIFNNYDIGGYLIFHLFPSEKVFVDNRPEAYPADFFQKVYIPLQEDESVWKEALAEYNFNAIIFSHRDATPWGQRFLVKRVRDRDWAPVFVDGRVAVFVRRTDENRTLIERSELPRDVFRISQ